MRSFALALLVLLAVPAAATARVVHFEGEKAVVPASWPVYRLAEHPRMCVRMDRRAVYLGTPSASQRCPAQAIGRQRAILVDPGAAARAAASAASPTVNLATTGDYTGLGFDACAAPSRQAMSAWGGSPYRAIGVYIGGINRGCSQPNLTSAWVGEQIAAGWHLIPTYVGLQAPGSSCSSCAKLSAGSATTQGTEAASDAVEDARAAGIGPGSPIYFDMESYGRSSSASNATLTFLAAWTTALHAGGYESGVYSSSASGIVDLAAKVGTSYPAPDNLWMANWNGAKSTDDPYVPSYAWSQHQRIHQYRGGHDESYGGVTINIDNNYVEGATVGSVSSATAVPKGRLDSASSPLPGQVRLTGWAFDPSLPTAPTAIRAYLGGPAGKEGSELYELGQVAVQPRPDVATTHLAAGANHGFDVSFPVAASKRQRVCTYAVSAGSEASKLLGCRTVGIAVPLGLSNLHSSRRGLHLRIGCEWPLGTSCPGQILLRTKVAVGRRGRTHLVRVGIAHRSFALTGGASHGFIVPLNSRGRALAQARGTMRAQLVVALPGGRVTRAVTLRGPR
jgi:glycoside hydrolase-like protein